MKKYGDGSVICRLQIKHGGTWVWTLTSHEWTVPAVVCGRSRHPFPATTGPHYLGARPWEFPFPESLSSRSLVWILPLRGAHGKRRRRDVSHCLDFPQNQQQQRQGLPERSSPTSLQPAHCRPPAQAAAVASSADSSSFLRCLVSGQLSHPAASRRLHSSSCSFLLEVS